MFEFSATGIDEAIKDLDALEKQQLPFALALSLTRTAQDIQSSSKELVKSVFNTPTPYVVNSFRVKAATKNNLSSLIWVKDDSVSQALTPQIFGGRRDAKDFTKVMRRKGLIESDDFLSPAPGAKKNRYGNISRAVIKSVISDLETGKRQRGSVRYFMFDSDNSVSDAWNNVIWKKVGRNGIEPFFIISKKAPSYKKRLPFYDVAKRTINNRAAINFHNAMDFALLSSIRRGG